MHEPFDRPADDEDDERKANCDQPGEPLPGTACNSKRRHKPDRRRRRQSLDHLGVGAIGLEDRSRPQKPDAGDNPLNGPADRIRINRPRLGQPDRDKRDERRPERNQRMRPQPRRLPPRLPIEPDQPADRSGSRKPHDKIRNPARMHKLHGRR